MAYFTPAPCYHDGADCSQRVVGCREKCEAWQQWQVLHEQEKEQKHAIYRKDKDINSFEALQGDRIHKLNRVRNAQEKARRR